MNNCPELLKKFILQALAGDLKTSPYPKEWFDLRLRIFFGMGMPARIPWIAFITPEMEVSEGFYPVYLFYKDLHTLILAYGVSETKEFSKSWPAEIMNSTETITAFFNQSVPRYGNSFVFKSYKIENENSNIKFLKGNFSEIATDKDLEADLETILDYYKKTVSVTTTATSSWSQGVFYMEKQLEDFIIHNWENTELGKKYELIVEEGDLISQQYRPPFRGCMGYQSC